MTTQNFIERGDLICDAARKLIDAYGRETSDVTKQLLDWIDHTQKEFKQIIDMNCYLDPEKIRAQGIEHFKPRYEVAKPNYEN